MKALQLTNYLSYVEVLFDFRPRIGQFVEFEFKGRKFKGIVVEIGRTALVEVKR